MLGGRSLLSLKDELVASTDLLFQSKLNYLLVLGPLAVVGNASGLVPEALCFFCAGVALIPCAERLSFVTEQVAEHTNGTIGALLNATFGNAPELLICVAALRSGYYRVVQLVMLGSMLTNMLLVFGLACLIGGLRWQVQELRMTSGNSNVIMLLVATAGSLFPAALSLSGQFDSEQTDSRVPTQEEVTFCRVNAAIMLTLYFLFLLFQLGTHRAEFDEAPTSVAKRNTFCVRGIRRHYTSITGQDLYEAMPSLKARKSSAILPEDFDHTDFDEDQSVDLLLKASDEDETADGAHRRRTVRSPSSLEGSPVSKRSMLSDKLQKDSDRPTLSPLEIEDLEEPHEPLISMPVGVIWLFLITLCISSMSDILVDTIEGFAEHMHLSEVFTSMVIIPFFSNIAEQVSAFIFAFRNEMDLCIGVTVGSAIQIATMVLPGSVLIGFVMNRSMTLYFHGYETVCLFFGVVVTSSVMQGGSTTWFTGVMLVGIYAMMAAGIWLHETEDLTYDAETLIQKGPP